MAMHWHRQRRATTSTGQKHPAFDVLCEGRLKMAGKILSDGGEEGWWVPKALVEKYPELTTLAAVLKRLKAVALAEATAAIARALHPDAF